MITVGAGTASNLTAVAKTGAYTAVAGDLVLADASSSAFTVTLPASPATGTTVGIKKTDTSANVVTVVGSGGAIIDGDASCTIVSEDAGATFVWTGTVWVIQSTAIPNTGTDALQSFWVPTYTSQLWYDRRTASANGAGLSPLNPNVAGTAGLAQSTIMYVPQYTHRALPIDQLAILTNAGTSTAGATVRFGLYAAGSNGLPTARLYDWGTISPTLANTVYSLAVSGTLPKGWTWWAVCLNAIAFGGMQGVAFSFDYAPAQLMGGSSVPTTASAPLGNRAYYEAGTALPATATPLAMTAGAAPNLPNVFFRAA